VTRAAAPYRYEGQAWRTGLTRIAGVDEAGRGPLAGPVVAAAVIIAPDRRVRGVNDSKVLPPERREELFALIQERAVAVGVGIVDHLTIDRINILEATRLAMDQALAALNLVPELIITDFVELRVVPCPQLNLVDGDARCASVAAASIIAKVTRDRLMCEMDAEYPIYGFARHKGYATPEHIAAIDRHGLCPLHRRSFVSEWRQQQLFALQPESLSAAASRASSLSQRGRGRPPGSARHWETSRCRPCDRPPR
jgi:ribonuclease HII